MNKEKLKGTDFSTLSGVFAKLDIGKMLFVLFILYSQGKVRPQVLQTHRSSGFK